MKDIIIKNRYLDSISSGDLLNNGRLKVQDIQGNLIFCEDFFGEINSFNKKNGECLSDSRCRPLEIVEEIDAFALNSYLPESKKYSFLSRISRLTIIEKSSKDMVLRVHPREYLIRDLNLEFCYEGNRMVRVYAYGHRFYRYTPKFPLHNDSDSAWCFSFTELEELDDHSHSLITHSYVESGSMKTLEIIINPASDEEKREYWENYNNFIKDKTVWSF